MERGNLQVQRNFNEAVKTNMIPSDITGSLFPHDVPHSKICFRCRLDALRLRAFCPNHGIKFACNCNMCFFALHPHELLEWAGRPVLESAIREMLRPYTHLVQKTDWFGPAASKALKKYGEYARKHHPRADVPDDVLRATGRMFCWYAEDLRFGGYSADEEMRDYSIEQFLR